MKKNIFYIAFLISISLFGSNEVENFFVEYKNSNIEKAKSISDNNPYSEFLRYYLYLNDRENFKEDETFLDLKVTDPISYILNHLNLGLYNYLANGNELIAIKNLKLAFIKAAEIENSVLICEIIKVCLEIYQRFSSKIGERTYIYFLEAYDEHAYDAFEKSNYAIKSFLLDINFGSSTKLYDHANLDSIHKTVLEITNTQYQYDGLLALSSYFQSRENRVEKSITLINKALDLPNKPITIFQYERYLSSQISLAIYKYYNNEFSEAKYILDAINLDSNKYIIDILNTYLDYWKYMVYDALGLEIESLRYANKSLLSQLKLDQSKQVQNVSEYETKYQTAEKEKQLLVEQQKKKQNRNIALTLGSLLLFGAVTFSLIQKNTKRKQLLAEQEKNLQTQKVSTLLKEQELKAIDAMISGQEKERQRIANDLHDDLGGLMATLKLHFNALKEKHSPELYDKTTLLLDNAYQKVRAVAHTKNSGVMANKGLLKAINDMAITVSQTNQLKIDVIDYGLDNRLENSLELTIFRIIQELITNIIKHAHATEASIHLTNHENSLNIMVEDNGKGFNAKTISKQSGMGIHSIDRRIENLGGEVTIESEINKGTTVIIDIPT